MSVVLGIIGVVVFVAGFYVGCWFVSRGLKRAAKEANSGPF